MRGLGEPHLATDGLKLGQVLLAALLPVLPLHAVVLQCEALHL